MIPVPYAITKAARWIDSQLIKLTQPKTQQAR